MEIDQNTDLVASAQSGDQGSLDAFSRLASDRLLTYFMRMVRNEQLAEDLAQDGCVEMVRSLQKLDDPTRFWPWLFRLAHRKACDHFRSSQSSMKKQRERPMDAALAGEVERNPEAGARQREMARIMREAMEQIKVSYRSILILRVFEQLPYAEIAAVTGQSELNSRALFFRAKAALKKQLSTRGIDKGMLMVALAAFGQSTRSAKATGASLTLSAGALEVGVAGSSLGFLGTKAGISIAILMAVCLCVPLVLNPSPEIPETKTLLQTEEDSVNSESQLELNPPADDFESLVSSEQDMSPDPMETSTEPAPRGAAPSPPRPFTTIQAAIDEAVHGDVVIVPSGIYTGLGNRDIDFRGKPITLRSEAGADSCIIDCQQQGRGFYFHGNESRSSVLSGFTIRNGLAQNGGAILCENSGPVIANCTLENNRALNSGGAIAGGNGVIRDCFISSNHARVGGGIRRSQGEIRDCILYNNRATNRGGGLNSCHGPIHRCIIILNVVETFNGGGLWDCDGRITNCLVTENSSGREGGGFAGCDGLIANCVIARNTAGNHYRNASGAGLFGCNGTLRNCTIVANEITGLGSSAYESGAFAARPAQGAGLYCAGGKTVAVNCIFWGNAPGQIDVDCNQGTCDIRYSTVQGQWQGLGNRSDPPRFSQKGLEEWSLASDSPCINAGDPNFITEPNEFDAQDQLRVAGTRVDMGAYEFVDPRLLHAVAGPDQILHDIRPVQLDAAVSLKVNRVETLDFAWRQSAGPPVHLSDPQAARTTFTPALAGTYQFELIIGDETRVSQPDTLEVTVGHNQGPRTDAGEDQLVSTLPEFVELDGTHSIDPEGDALRYQWQQIAGPPVQLVEPNRVICRFAPVKPGFYTFHLTVSDARGAFDANTVNITLGSDSLLLAEAGATLYAGNEPVSLDGSASHGPPGVSPSFYRWHQLSGPSPLVMSDAEAVKPRLSGFVQSNSIQTFVFELTVGTPEHGTHSDQVELRVVPRSATNELILENMVFDPAKPTIVFWGASSMVSGYGNRRWQRGDWQDHVNVLSFNYRRDLFSTDAGGRRFRRCGDMLIAYLNRVAPTYTQAIQAIGFSGGGMACIDAARYMNDTFADPRYAINKVVLLSFGNSSMYLVQESIDALLENPIEGETCHIENYFPAWPQPYVGGIGPVRGALNVAFDTQDTDFVLDWYQNSLATPDLLKVNDGVVAGATRSVMGSAWDTPLGPGTHHYRWEGNTTQGRMTESLGMSE